MHTIAIISQKGGTGKTTLALNLAVASELAGKPALVVDLDPQASAKAWHDHRTEKTPIVISAQASRLHEVLKAAEENGAALVILDTAPHSESSALAAARAADLILIPCRPGVLDIRAIATSADLVQLAKKQAVAVLNAIPPQGHLPDEAGEAIKSFGLAVSPIRITNRAAFVHSLTASTGVSEYEPDGKAADEIKQLYKWTLSQMNVLTRQQNKKEALAS
jgi:chromosome partitioning protein